MSSSSLPQRGTEILPCRRAGIPIARNGRFLDFHSLRTTFRTTLGQRGVPLVVTQKLMRHSTPVLTSNLYSQFSIAELAKAVEKLPNMGVSPGSQAAVKHNSSGSRGTRLQLGATWVTRPIFKTSDGFEQSSPWVRFPSTPVQVARGATAFMVSARSSPITSPLSSACSLPASGAPPLPRSASFVCR